MNMNKFCTRAEHWTTLRGDVSRHCGSEKILIDLRPRTAAWTLPWAARASLPHRVVPFGLFSFEKCSSITIRIRAVMYEERTYSSIIITIIAWNEKQTLPVNSNSRGVITFLWTKRDSQISVAIEVDTERKVLNLAYKSRWTGKEQWSRGNGRFGLVSQGNQLVIKSLGVTSIWLNFSLSIARLDSHIRCLFDGCGYWNYSRK